MLNTQDRSGDQQRNVGGSGGSAPCWRSSLSTTRRTRPTMRTGCATNGSGAGTGSCPSDLTTSVRSPSSVHHAKRPLEKRPPAMVARPPYQTERLTYSLLQAMTPSSSRCKTPASESVLRFCQISSRPSSRSRTAMIGPSKGTASSFPSPSSWSTS